MILARRRPSLLAKDPVPLTSPQLLHAAVHIAHRRRVLLVELYEFIVRMLFLWLWLYEFLGEGIRPIRNVTHYSLRAWVGPPTRGCGARLPFRPRKMIFQPETG